MFDWGKWFSAISSVEFYCCISYIYLEQWSLTYFTMFPCIWMWGTWAEDADYTGKFYCIACLSETTIWFIQIMKTNYVTNRCGRTTRSKMRYLVDTRRTWLLMRFVKWLKMDAPCSSSFEGFVTTNGGAMIQFQRW